MIEAAGNVAVSAIVIARNNERTIARCIESLRWAREIIVIDGGSTDRTADICRELGAVVHLATDWQGYGAQKNRALDRASGAWVLSLDTDEWISPELRAEILRVLESAQTHSAYAMPRRSSFCGRYIRHSGWWPDYVVRLFRREAGRFSDDLVHEKVIVDGTTGRLREPVMHEAVVDLEQLIDKVNAYSSAGARMKLHEQQRAGLLSALGHGFWAFVRTYIVRRGFLDGAEGLMLAISNAEASYYRYVKLMLLARSRDDARGPKH